MTEKLKARPSSTEIETSSHIPVNPLYTPADLKGSDYESEVGYPGEYPFTRGVQATMYRGRLWTMRQYAGMGDAEESNKRYKYLLANGTTGLSVAFDLPTQIGLDSDHPLAAGEVGKVGVAIDSLEDMQTLFNSIPLEKVSTSMTINATAAILLALYVAVAKQQGANLQRLAGTVQNDILKEYIARGTYIYPLRPAMRIVTDIFAWCRGEVPNWNAISISGYHIREAGSTDVQEVAFTIANGIAYVEAAIGAGLPVDEFAPQLSFFFNSHNEFLMQIAKFRAARRLWARTMRNRFHARDPRSLMLRFHAQTAGSSLTAQQPENNLVRVALQSLAAETGLAREAAERLLQRLVFGQTLLQIPGEILLGSQAFDAACEAIRSVLQQHASGVKRSELKTRTSLRPEILDFSLQRLVRADKLQLNGELVCPVQAGKPPSAPDPSLSAIAAIYRQTGLSAPLISEVAATLKLKQSELRGLVTLLLREKILVQMGSEDLFMHHEALARLRSEISELHGQTVDIARFKQLTGLSRKYAIPLLEYLDRQRITRKMGDQRLVI